MAGDAAALLAKEGCIMKYAILSAAILVGATFALSASAETFVLNCGEEIDGTRAQTNLDRLGPNVD